MRAADVMDFPPLRKERARMGQPQLVWGNGWISHQTVECEKYADS